MQLQKPSSQIVLLLTVLFVGAVGFTMWASRAEQKKLNTINSTTPQPATPDTTPTDQHTKLPDGQRKLHGSSVFLEQGPTDAIVGETPAQATLLIGNAAKLKAGEYSNRPATTPNASSVKKSTITAAGARIATTTKGDYELVLNDADDTVCLMMSEQQNAAYNDQAYHYANGGNCVRLTDMDAGNYHIDAQQISFGVSRLVCEHHTACVDFAPVTE